jgi:hypothetical protein
MAHNVDGIWELVQSNAFRVRVDIAQSRDPSGALADGGLHGAAKELNPAGVELAEANLSGALNGSSFEFTVAWPNGSTGQYTGNFDAGGHLSGVTFDVAHPTSQATWFRQEPQF